MNNEQDSRDNEDRLRRYYEERSADKLANNHCGNCRHNTGDKCPGEACCSKQEPETTESDAERCRGCESCDCAVPPADDLSDERDLLEQALARKLYEDSQDTDWYPDGEPQNPPCDCSMCRGEPEPSVGIRFVDAEVRKLDLQPNDTLMFTFKSNSISRDDLAELKKGLIEKFPGNKILLLVLPPEDDMMVTVIKAADAAAQTDEGAPNGC